MAQRRDDNSIWLPSRRALLKSGAGALAAIGTGFGHGPASAQAVPHRFKVGTAEVTVLSDGAMEVPTNVMIPGREQAEIEAVFKRAGHAFAGLRSEINVAVVKTGADLILIDTGGGPDFVPTLGKLGERMEAAGFKPEAITKVIFTHAHPDHLWGVIDPLGGGTAFEKAEHVMCKPEFDFWMKADVDTRVGEAFRGMAVGTHRRLKSIADRIKTVEAGAEIAPGLAVVGTPGHTPGHVSILIKSGGEQLLIGGDVLIQHVVSFAAPDWRWGPDLDSDAAAASRRRTLDMLATDKARLLGYHLPWPGVGHVERKDAAYRFVPA